MLTIVALAAFTPQNIQPEEILDGRRSTLAVEFGDVTADGVVDCLVLTSAGEGEIRLRLGSPSGLFATGAVLEHGTGGSLVELGRGDVDGDGRPDVVGGLAGAGVVLWRGEGAGAFAAAEQISGSQLLQVSDLDGDGTDEVLVRSGSALRRLTPAPPGAGWGSAALLTAGLDPVALAAADLDGDGDVDLGYGDGGSIGWAENDGSGGFTEVEVAAGPAPFDLEDVRVDAFDQDGDGAIDLVMGTSFLVVDPFNPSTILDRVTRIDLMRGAANGPQGSRVSVATESSTRRYAPIDLDDDGLRDLVLAQNFVRVRFASAGGSYGPPVALEGAALQFAGLDLDSDGATDLVQVRPGGSITGASLDPAAPQPRLTAPRTIYASNRLAGDAELVDVDGDGGLDLAFTGRFSEDVVAFLGDGDGGLGEHFLFGAVPDLWGEPGWGDIDGDGATELVFVGSGGLVGSLERRPDGRSDSRELFQLAGGPLPVGSTALIRIADFDADGDNDIGVLDDERQRFDVYVQGPAGDFAAGSTATVDHAIRSVLAEDLDGDGAADLLIDGKLNPMFTNGPRRLRRFMNDGAGTFGPGTTLVTFSALVPNELGEALFPGDIDQDGLVDVFRVGVGRDPITAQPTDQYGVDLFFGTGGGGLSGPVPFGLPTADDPIPEALVDVDGDGALDIVGLARATSSARRVVWWYRGNGDGTFQSAARLGTGEPLFFAIAAGDLDDDGDADVVTRSSDGAGFLFEIQARGAIGEPYCVGATVPNSVGTRGVLSASGSADVRDGALVLTASDLPPSVIGLFVTGTAPGAIPIANSIGTLCVGGQIGRFAAPGQIQVTDASGAMSLTVDLGALPLGAGAVSAAPGTTRYFQAWHRDVRMGAQTSNLTQGLRVFVY